MEVNSRSVKARFPSCWAKNYIQAARENKNDVNLNLVILVISSKDYQKRATNGYGYNGLEIMSTLL